MASKIGELTSPLFDVVTESQLAQQYSNPFASIHLSVPKMDDPENGALEVLKKWKENNIIVQDPVPGIYVYYQHYSLPGSVNELTRKGFIAFIHLDDQILQHEGTIPNQLGDRVHVIEETELNVSPTHGFYSDPEFELDSYMDDSIKYPIYETEDYQGVKDILSVIHDRKIIQSFIKKISDQKIILGDGHHRYKASVDYRDKMRGQNPNHNGSEAYNYHLMYFSNAESPDIRILATHRLLSGMENFDENSILDQLDHSFTITKVEDAFNLADIIHGKKWTFGLLFKDNAYRIKLKPEIFEQSPPPGPDVLKEIDINVVHHYIVDRIIEQGNISYDRSFSDCYAKVLQGHSQLGIIVNEIRMEKVMEVCYSGYTLPPKSTYFYPKVVSGFMFGSINEDEFRFPLNISF